MSRSITTETFLRPYLFLFEELAGDPPKGGRGNAVLDTDTGWTQTLAAVDAERASRPVAAGGTTIAAQAAHTAYYVELLERIVEGERPKADWPGSFAPSTVDGASWAETRSRLLGALTRFRAIVESQREWSEEHVRGALGILVHTAYHLGAVRQMMRVVGGSDRLP